MSSLVTGIAAKKSTTEFDRSVLEMGRLVGHNVTLYSGQYPGKPLTARVVQTDGDYLALERVGYGTLIDNLVSNQSVIVRFDYKAEQVCTAAVFKRTNGGKITVVMGDTVKPLKRRRFVRVPTRQPINLAVLPAGRFRPTKLPHLRWIKTQLVDFSSGGALFDINSFLQEGSNLFVNVELESYPLPPLMIGTVRHCTQREAGHFNIGLEFVIGEQRKRYLSGTVLKDLPASALKYSYLHRKSLDAHISAWTQETNHTSDERYFK